jgi:hypothetical protein
MSFFNRVSKLTKFGNYEIILPQISTPIKRTVPSHIGFPEYALTTIPRELNSIIKNSQHDVNGITNASKLAARVLDAACKAARVGITTFEIDQLVFMTVNYVRFIMR